MLAKQSLTLDDEADLFALFKAAHGIPDPKARTPKPLIADQIPAPVKNSTHVELRAMKNLRHVNAIAENQHLPFGTTGLTVIYGDNGSGKSGYSRMLKRACRARDQIEAIHPNVHLPADKTAAAEAVFEIAVNGVAQDVCWINGKASPPELSSLAIFDSRCARAYLDSEDDFSYVPYGLDVFEGLAKVCRQLKTLTETEYAQSAADLSAFAPLQGDTAVGKLIAKLSAKTTTTQIEALATLIPEELAIDAELDKSLKENNPKERASQLRAAHALTLNLDDVTYGEIAAMDAQLATDTRAFEQARTVRQEVIKAAVISHQWDDTDQALHSLAARLQALADKLNTEAETLEKASDEAARAALQNQFNDLDARVRLNQVKNAVVTAVSRLGHQAKLKQCLPAVDTRSISLKASELAAKVVSKELADALNREFKALGVGSLRVMLQSRSDKGKPLHKLKLELPQSRNPGEILSEGEQRAIAIGSFLAEVGLSNGKGSIVFDDPVSSLAIAAASWWRGVW